MKISLCIEQPSHTFFSSSTFYYFKTKNDDIKEWYDKCLTNKKEELLNNK